MQDRGAGGEDNKTKGNLNWEETKKYKRREKHRNKTGAKTVQEACQESHTGGGTVQGVVLATEQDERIETKDGSKALQVDDWLAIDTDGGAQGNDQGSATAVTLFDHGQIHKEAEAKSLRLSVTADCGLHIKKVTDQHVGQYSCRQVISGVQQSPDSHVHLYVIQIIEQKSNDGVSLFCNVQTREHCRYTVEWLYEGKENITSEMEMSPGSCSATVTLSVTLFNQKSKIFESLKCKVTNDHTKEVELFPFSHQSSGDKTGGDATTTTTTTIKSTATKLTTKPTSTIRSDGTSSDGWSWWYIAAPVGLAALTVIAAVIIRQTAIKGNKRQKEENTAKAEAGDYYTSISFSKKTKNEAQVQSDTADEGGAVTYSTVNASSSSAGVFCDPSSFYSTVNIPKK
ncbi:uncharacterized protein LOC115774593 [Archocentrus centrarchus]|uniref:uncharacterized protein LOC115774593 n=1 Tax=Archocentrus centrarchus TaxID=63155 RepID=UPI0011EA4C51|nr:uncharacterized protein LOC115774593 [Archocentrus centrarchus]